MPSKLRDWLGEALAQVSSYYANLSVQSATEIEQYQTTFLHDYRIYCLTYFHPNKPIVFYVGAAPERPAYLLTEQRDQFIAMARNDAVMIESNDIARDYSVAFLEVTRTLSQLFYLVESIKDIKFRPGLDMEEKRVKSTFIQAYRSKIVPPAVQSTTSGYSVTIHAVREQALEQHTLTVTQSSEIRDEIAIVANDLPLVYGL